MSEISKLLVVDDEELNRDVLSRRLRRAGYQVEVAESGPAALEVLAKQKIELILLDNMMPGMTGIDLLKLLRGTYSPAALPVIMVTALAESERIVQALTLGANDYVTKPVDFPVALARIRAQLERKEAEDALRESEERYALAARGANDGIWDFDVRKSEIYFSPRWKQILGFLDSEIPKRYEEWLRRVHPEDSYDFVRNLDRCRVIGGPGEFIHEHRLLHKDGSYRWMLVRAVIRRSDQGEALRMAGSMTDVTINRAFDPLTGLANRVLLTERIADYIARREQDAELCAAVLLLDLDRFKVVNDSMGHLAGDQLLVAVSRRLERAVRSAEDRPAPHGHDLVARLGGDEFAVFLPDIATLTQASTVADRILRTFTQQFRVDGRELTVEASIGAALLSADHKEPGDILRDADIAMYNAKALGKGRCSLFTPEMRAKALDRLELEADLRGALERDELVVYYQPKVDLITEQVVGFEALLRWRHPKRGLVSPVSFIPIAEETGLILPIGLWVMRTACATIRKWQHEFPHKPPLEISVNLSVVQFRQKDLTEQIVQVLEESGINPSSLQFEITESVLIEDTDAAISILNRLRELGIGLKIDDFGTGYSSLKYLTNLPFDSLKIDRSFLTQMVQDAGSMDVIRTIVDLANGLDMQVIAEGVETREQVRRLRDLGCNYGQGYLYSRPVPEEEAHDLLTGKRPLITE